MSTWVEVHPGREARLRDRRLIFRTCHIRHTEDRPRRPFGDMLPRVQQALDRVSEVAVALALAVQEGLTQRVGCNERSFINGTNLRQALGSHEAPFQGYYDTSTDGLAQHGLKTTHVRRLDVDAMD